MYRWVRGWPILARIIVTCPWRCCGVGGSRRGGAAGDGITEISLCGMGGERIRDILESGKARLSGAERLILQPNGGEQPLRQWLMDNGYCILCEDVLRENRFYYEVIVAERIRPVLYSAEELYFGPRQLQQRSPAFLTKWQRILRLKQ